MKKGKDNEYFNLIIKSNISLLWLQECKNPVNKDKKIGDLLENFTNKYAGIDLINEGTIIMASYILFIYPREIYKEENIIDFNEFEKLQESINNFKITPKITPNNLLRRIRNSLAHGNFYIENNVITFEDYNKNDKFKAKINISDFGFFLNEFMFAIKNKVYSSPEKK